jgi:antitoxin component of RelBE/YafQ-DinJ toxin-antitoxin module
VGKVAAPVVEKTAEATSGAPSYFFDLVNKIKILGNEGRSISPRKKTINYKNYQLEEDLTTGDLVVIKQKGDPDFAYEEEVMVLRKGQADETTKGKTPPDEYEELTVRPDEDGKMKDVEEGIEPEGIKEILEELDVGGGNLDELTLQEIKKGKLASGGRVGLLSGGGVIRVMLKKLAERYGKKPSELLAVTNYKSLPVEVRKFLTKEQFELIKKDMQASRVEQFENLRDMVKSRQKFDRSAEALKKMGMDISDTMLPLMNKAVAPSGTTADDLLMMEQVIKNLRMKDRKLNASGGLAGMLGE